MSEQRVLIVIDMQNGVGNPVTVKTTAEILADWQ